MTHVTGKVRARAAAIIGLVMLSIAPIAAVGAPPTDINLYGKIPLSFEPNLGQTDAPVKFISRGQGYTLFLTPDEAVLVVKNDAAQQETALRMKLVGANPHVQIEGADLLAARSNYFFGNDSNKGRTNIPNYARVRYRNIYSRIDLVYYGTEQDQLEYDFILAPGANPNAIALRFDGAKELALNHDGDLVAKLSDGSEIVHRAPAIYQARDGKQRKIDGRCILRGKNTIGFELGAYDRTRAVYIDPGLVYSTYLGGSSRLMLARGDAASGVAVDAAGSAYVTGWTMSADFPTTAGAFQTTLKTAPRRKFGKNAFVTKLSSDGKALAYSTYLGGSANNEGIAIAVDSNGSAYVTGETNSSDFPTTAGAFQPTLKNYIGNAFVTKLSPTGAALIYSTFLGGSGHPIKGPPQPGKPFNSPTGTESKSIAVDAAGSAYVTGGTNSFDFPTTSGAFQPTLKGDPVYPSALNDDHFGNAFVTKLTADGSALAYSTYLGGGGGDLGYGIAVDDIGSAYVTGFTRSFDNSSCKGNGMPSKCCTGAGSGTCRGFPITTGAVQTNHSCNPLSSACGSAAFVTKLNASGNALVYSTYLGGIDNQGGNTIAVYSPPCSYLPGLLCRSIRRLFGISSDSAYVTGWVRSSDFPTTRGAFQTLYYGRPTDWGNAFVTKLNGDGTALVYSTFLGGGPGGLGAKANAIAVDSAGDAYVAGDAGYSITNANCTGHLIANSNSHAGCCTGPGSGACNPFPTTTGALQPVSKNPAGDPFVTKLNATGSALLYSTYLGGSTGRDEATGIAVDPSGSAYVTGRASSPDFPTTTGAFQTTSEALDDRGFGVTVFVSKLDMIQITAPTPAAAPKQ